MDTYCCYSVVQVRIARIDVAMLCRSGNPRRGHNRHKCVGWHSRDRRSPALPASTGPPDLQVKPNTKRDQLWQKDLNKFITSSHLPKIQKQKQKSSHKLKRSTKKYKKNMPLYFKNRKYFFYLVFKKNFIERATLLTRIFKLIIKIINK